MKDLHTRVCLRPRALRFDVSTLFTPKGHHPRAASPENYRV